MNSQFPENNNPSRLHVERTHLGVEPSDLNDQSHPHVDQGTQSAEQNGASTSTPSRPPLNWRRYHPNLSLPLEQRAEEVRRIAIEMFSDTEHWVVFYREILGVGGLARTLFKTLEDYRHWEKCPQFEEIQQMICAKRTHDTDKGDTIEPQRMITVRLPVSLHEALKEEASDHGQSINKLCISKLLQQIAPKLVPVELGKLKGRKPGPQGWGQTQSPASTAAEHAGSRISESMSREGQPCVSDAR